MDVCMETSRPLPVNKFELFCFFLLFRAARMDKVIFVGEKSGPLFRYSFELS